MISDSKRKPTGKQRLWYILRIFLIKLKFVIIVCRFSSITDLFGKAVIYIFLFVLSYLYTPNPILPFIQLNLPSLSKFTRPKLFSYIPNCQESRVKFALSYENCSIISSYIRIIISNCQDTFAIYILFFYYILTIIYGNDAFLQC